MDLGIIKWHFSDLELEKNILRHGLCLENQSWGRRRFASAKGLEFYFFVQVLFRFGILCLVLIEGDPL